MTRRENSARARTETAKPVAPCAARRFSSFVLYLFQSPSFSGLSLSFVLLISFFLDRPLSITRPHVFRLSHCFSLWSQVWRLLCFAFDKPSTLLKEKQPSCALSPLRHTMRPRVQCLLFGARGASMILSFSLGQHSCTDAYHRCIKMTYL